MNDENDNFTNFLDEMDDVKQLTQDKHSSIQKREDTALNDRYRQKAATQKKSPYANFLTDGDVPPVEPNEILSYKLSGIQPQVFKNLRQAKYQFDYHLDLHRYTVKEARDAIFKLINSAHIEDYRCFLVTHGKGERSKEPAKLKAYVNHWLRQIEQIVAFHSAMPKHGGTGSTYVLLKKPKQKRRINQAKYK
ncbi:MAG: DNA endonuclease SmrA [Kangiellaceae bacterium]|nr:DNA endonuclease SmrA [Kangiellaceae bacterium]